MSVTGRKIVGAIDRELTAVITIALPAGGEVELDPTWRFVGWQVDHLEVPGGNLSTVVVREPIRVDIDEEEPDAAD